MSRPRVVCCLGLPLWRVWICSGKHLNSLTRATKRSRSRSRSGAVKCATLPVSPTKSVSCFVAFSVAVPPRSPYSHTSSPYSHTNPWSTVSERRRRLRSPRSTQVLSRLARSGYSMVAGVNAGAPPLHLPVCAAPSLRRRPPLDDL
jgi:hypothetical protein